MHYIPLSDRIKTATLPELEEAKADVLKWKATAEDLMARYPEVEYKDKHSWLTLKGCIWNDENYLTEIAEREKELTEKFSIHEEKG